VAHRRHCNDPADAEALLLGPGLGATRRAAGGGPSGQLLLYRRHDEPHDRRLGPHAVELQAAMQGLGDAGRELDPRLHVVAAHDSILATARQTGKAPFKEDGQAARQVSDQRAVDRRLLSRYDRSQRHPGGAERPTEVVYGAVEPVDHRETAAVHEAIAGPDGGDRDRLELLAAEGCHDAPPLVRTQDDGGPARRMLAGQLRCLAAELPLRP